MPSPFLSAVTENMRMKHYAEKTIKAYLYWITSFIYYNQKKHPNECHDDKVQSFLSYLANQRNGAPKTQSLALMHWSLYKKILNSPFILEVNFK